MHMIRLNYVSNTKAMSQTKIWDTHTVEHITETQSLIYIQFLLTTEFWAWQERNKE